MPEKHLAIKERFRDVMNAMPTDYRGRAGVEFWQTVAPHIHPAEDPDRASASGLNTLIALFVVGANSHAESVLGIRDFLKQSLKTTKALVSRQNLSSEDVTLYRSAIRDCYAFRGLLLKDSVMDPTMILLRELEKVIDGAQPGMSR
jgi:hypothetical protein